MEDKQIFFALYFLQKKIVCRNGFINRDNVNPITVDEFDQLELKQVTTISDEEKIFLIKNDFYDHVKFENPSPLNLWDYGKILESQYAIDYLRSKGFALPWREISVKEQVELGWIKFNH